MANPQKEDGFIPIANEIAEAFVRLRIPGEAWEVLWFILRKTYGFNKKSDWISLRQFSEASGLPRQTVFRALKRLISMNIVIKNDDIVIKNDDSVIKNDDSVIKKGCNVPLSYSFNKDYESWNLSSKKVTGCNQKRLQGVTIYDEHNIHNKYNIHNIKNNIKYNIAHLKKGVIKNDDSVIKNDDSKRLRKEVGSDFHKSISYFTDEYFKKFGIGYHFEDGKHGKMMKDLIKSFGYDKLCKIIDALFESEDEFIKRKGYTIETLKWSSNTLAQQKLGSSRGKQRQQTIEELNKELGE